MIQKRLHDKDNDIQGLKKQSSALLNCAWEKGYVAGFNDGYATKREADKRPQGEWVDYSEEGFIECPFCHKATTCEDNIEELHYCWNCGAKLWKGVAE